MTPINARRLILGMNSGPQLDALIDTIIFKKDCQPLFCWDSQGKVGQFYPYVAERFSLMRVLDGDENCPIHLPSYSSNLDLAELVMKKFNITLSPIQGTTYWKASSGGYTVTSTLSAVSVCQLALLKKLKL